MDKFVAPYTVSCDHLIGSGHLTVFYLGACNHVSVNSIVLSGKAERGASEGFESIPREKRKLRSIRIQTVTVFNGKASILGLPTIRCAPAAKSC